MKSFTAAMLSHSVTAVAVRAFCLLAKASGSFRLKLQAQGLLIHSVEVRSVALNTAPQFVDLMVSTLDKKGC